MSKKKRYHMLTPYRELTDGMSAGQTDYTTAGRDDGLVEFGVDYSFDYLTVKQTKQLIALLQSVLRDAMKAGGI